jgi:GTPase SAR1 family protein
MDYRDSVVAVLAYAIDDRNSFDKLGEWIENLQRDTRVMPLIVIVGNKTDLDPTVSSEAAEYFPDRVGAQYIESSARTEKRRFWPV